MIHQIHLTFYPPSFPAIQYMYTVHVCIHVYVCVYIRTYVCMYNTYIFNTYIRVCIFRGCTSVASWVRGKALYQMSCLICLLHTYICVHRLYVFTVL